MRVLVTSEDRAFSLSTPEGGNLPVILGPCDEGHIIDKERPLYGVTAPGLEESDALLVLNFGGLDDGSAQQLYARHVYSWRGIRWRRRYSEQQETRLGELAKRLDEDVAIIRDHFTAFVGMQSWAASTNSWNVELWPDPVEGSALLRKISAKIRKYIVLRPEALIATALWTMTAWAHEGATHSPILAAISVEPDSGKSTLLGVLRFLVPKPFVSVEPTGPSVYRTVDREHPTLIIDEADDLFYRKSDLRAIVNAG